MTFDDAESLVTDLYNVIVANGQFVAGGVPIAPQADPGDGLLDALLIPKRSAAEMALLAAEMLLGKYLSNDAVIFRHAEKSLGRWAAWSAPVMFIDPDNPLAAEILQEAGEVYFSACKKDLGSIATRDVVQCRRGTGRK